MAVSPIEVQPVQEAPPVHEAPKKPAEQETRGLSRKVFEKLTSLEVFQTHKDELFAYAQRRTDECIAKGAQKLTELVTATHISPAGAERVVQRTQVQEKLAANEARFRAAFKKFTERIAETLKTHVAETVTPAAIEQKDQPKTPETAAERREKIIEGSQIKRASLLKRALSGAVDLIPFVGGVKITGEALAGETSTGVKMDGKERIIHAFVGVASFVLDATGVGEAGKAIGIVGRSIEAVAKLGEQLAEKGFAKAAALMTRTAGFMAAHPELVLKGEELAEQKIGGAIKSTVKNVNDYRDGKRPVVAAQANPRVPNAPLQEAA
jgi:menaquinone-dependent protoporphyrinogen IX oxidase